VPTEVWGMYPPEINAGRYESGVGAPSWVASALKWSMFAGIAIENNVALAAQVGALTGNWQGGASAAFAGRSAPFAAWLAEMQAIAVGNAQTALSVLQAYSIGNASMIPLPLVVANRVAARTAQLAGVLGAPNTEMVRLELEYAGFWSHNAAVMNGYDTAVNTATMYRQIPSPPPLVLDGGFGGLEAAHGAAQNVSQSLGQGAESAHTSVGNGMAQAAQNMFGGQSFSGPSTSDSTMWSNLIGGGASASSGTGLSAFGGSGSGGGSGASGLGGGMAGVGLMPSSSPLASMAKPGPVSAGGPSAGFGGVSNAPTSARPASPMMPPMHGANNGIKKDEQRDNPYIVAADQAFPIADNTRLSPTPEQPSENQVSRV
jgi:PPE-repeat protein